MGQVLTINFNRSNYDFQVIKLDKVAGIIESQILLNGTTVTLCKDRERGWTQKNASNQIVQELIRAIGNSISLRYRV